MTKVLSGKELDQAAIDAAIARSPFNAHEKAHVAVGRSVMALMYKDGYRASEAAYANYRALEELRASDAECLSKVNELLQAENHELKKELAALRGQYEMVRQCCMDETVRATRLMGDLDDLRKKSDSLVVASVTARRELQSCQAVIHLNGGFDPAYVEGAQKAMRDLSAALEALK